MIPFVDLKAQYFSIKDEIDEAIQRVIINSSFIGGEEVKLFENNFAEWLGIDYFIGCANGTDSIEILLKGLGIGPNDEVIVPALSWISTSEAVTAVGAKPIFVDIHKEYFTINEDLIEDVITPNTKAIIPVHLYGQSCNMDKIIEIANRHGLKVLEDCAQAHGAMWNGQKVGTFGQCSSFSFFPGKNLGAYGDAGGMATNDPNLAKYIRMVANHGQINKHEHEIEGRNSRLDAMQAAILNVKLKYLDIWTEARRQRAKYYIDKIKNEEIQNPIERELSKHVFHLFVIKCKNRKLVIEILNKYKISHSIHYPVPLPNLKPYFNENGGKFPVADFVTKEILSLPLFPELEFETIDLIANVLTDIH